MAKQILIGIKEKKLSEVAHYLICEFGIRKNKKQT